MPSKKNDLRAKKSTSIDMSHRYASLKSNGRERVTFRAMADLSGFRAQRGGDSQGGREEIATSGKVRPPSATHIAETANAGMMPAWLVAMTQGWEEIATLRSQ